MTTLDTKVPQNLLKTQQWFGKVISQNINSESRINPIAPSGKPIKEEAPQFIAPSPTLEPFQRIELYHQQYWWRLLNTLHDAFPLVVRLFGYHSFNEKIAKPYLLACPPNSWSLNPLGDRLAEWVEKHYEGSDKTLLYNAAKLDYIYIDSFVSEELSPIKETDEATLLEKPLILQPHVQPITFPYDMPTFRREMLKESVEHWIDNPFPTLSKKKRFYFVMARTRRNDIGWSEITLPEFLLLEQLKKPQTLMQLCEWLEHQKREVVNVASKNLQKC
jgi:hypothetical protein